MPRFIVDESTGPGVAGWLQSQGHDVVSIFESYRGMDDEDILEMAADSSRVLITNDKDFGDLVFRHGLSHAGVILLRLSDDSTPNKINVLQGVLQQHFQELEGGFVTATERVVRVS